FFSQATRAARRRRSAKRPKSGRASQADWKPVVEQPPCGKSEAAATGGVFPVPPPALPEPVPAPAGVVGFGAGGGVSLPSAWRMMVASCVRAASICAGEVTAWYVTGYTLFAMATAWSFAPA